MASFSQLIFTGNVVYQQLSTSQNTMFCFVGLFVCLFVFFMMTWINSTNLLTLHINTCSIKRLKAVLHPGPYFRKLCVFSQKNFATLDKVYPMDLIKKCSKELKDHSCILENSMVVKFHKNVLKIHIFHVLIHKSFNQ